MVNRRSSLAIVFFLSSLTFPVVVPTASYGYNIEISKELEEAENRHSEEEAKEGAKKAEAEAQQRKEQEEQAKVAQEHAVQERNAQEQKLQQESVARETSEKEAVERQRKAQAESTMCVVPNIKGSSLQRARTVLQQNHCRLGKVSRSRRHRHRNSGWIVTSQQYRPAERLPVGTQVSVTLGPPAAGHK